jgi:hypothetical protein
MRASGVGEARRGIAKAFERVRIYCEMIRGETLARAPGAETSTLRTSRNEQKVKVALEAGN